MLNIKFGFRDNLIYKETSLQPKLIKHEKPSWYRNLKKRIVVNALPFSYDIQTVKSCPSFVDMFNNGVVIYAPTDIKLFYDTENEIHDFKLPYQTDNYKIEIHEQEQFISHLPKENKYKFIFKLVLPLAVFTDKGVSSYQYNYPYGFNNDFEVLFGQFETDKVHEVNLQLGYISEKKEITITKGTPLAIYLPFKRSKVKLDLFNLDNNKKYKKIFETSWFKLNSKFNRYYGDL